MKSNLLPTLLAGLAPVFLFTPLAAQDTEKKAGHGHEHEHAAEDQAELEKKFEALMTGCKMVGKFTMRNAKKPAQEDTYTIAKVEKVKDSKWRFHAKIKYGTKSVTVPLVVDVVWAGDTPVIQVTKMAIPFLGTYSARVLVYEGEYAGTWSGTGYGGQMYGKIVRASDEAEAEPGATDAGNKKGPPKEKAAIKKKGPGKD